VEEWPDDVGEKLDLQEKVLRGSVEAVFLRKKKGSKDEEGWIKEMRERRHEEWRRYLGIP
jgi:hypothetical protein